ncbi:hypothetical protein [Burkholderia seminalis]|uniref:hypothetical protein n=1 Tax=Burkholderia seminalis TaxID=488731 RepID=UPI0016397FD7|nr:hypothetical protein [Burkholderia seminalis]
MKRTTGKGLWQSAEPTETGATEVIRHIVMWKLRGNFVLHLFDNKEEKIISM